MEKELIYLACPYTYNGDMSTKEIKLFLNLSEENFRKIVMRNCKSSNFDIFDKKIRQKRFEQVTHVLAHMLENGDNVFSPITMAHPTLEYIAHPISHSRWLELDFAYLKVCKEIRVLMLEGWAESAGVLLEIEYALKHGISITWVDPKDYFGKERIW